MRKRIKKVHNILMERLPKNCRIPIMIFKGTEKLLRFHAKRSEQSYRKVIKHYDKYLFSPKTASYTKTKYFSHRPKKALEISALGGNPIYVSAGRLKELAVKDYEIAHLLLHEIGHNILFASSLIVEKACDIFASRWIRKLIKEKLIKKAKQC